MTQSKHKCSRCGAEMCEDEFCTGDICLDCARVDESTNVNDWIESKHIRGKGDAK